MKKSIFSDNNSKKTAKTPKSKGFGKKKKRGFFDFDQDIGIDLGTASIIIFVKGRGLVLNEPSVVAIDKKSGEVIAVGKAAHDMLGRTPGSIEAIRPLREGVIADYEVTEKMLRYFIEQACGKNWIVKPRIMVCIPSGVTNVEERAVKQAALQSGARQAFLMEEPLAAALGARLNVHDANGTMIVDIGGGTTDIAVISLGGIVCSSSIKMGGDKLDEAIVRHIRREHNLLIGDRCAEDIKRTIGTAKLTQENSMDYVSVRGRNLISGLPESIDYTAIECHEAIREPLEAIVQATKDVLEKTPPELAADIVDHGLVLTGGGAMLDGLAEMISEATELHVQVAEDPVACVALGTGQALEMLDRLGNAKYFARKAL